MLTFECTIRHIINISLLYSLYRKLFTAEYGVRKGPLMLSALERQVQQYNESCKDTCAKVTASASGDAIVAICSPLMKRVHTTRRSGELCFIDSSGCTNFLPSTPEERRELLKLIPGGGTVNTCYNIDMALRYSHSAGQTSFY